MKAKRPLPCALVTGATGFMGSRLTRRLVQHGWKVHIIARPQTKMDLLKDVLGQIRIYVHDGITSGIIKYIGKIAPDVVFHMATMFRASHQISEIEEMIKSNVLFGTQVAEALTYIPNSKMINCGTSWQHFDGKPYSPVALYSATKQAMQDVLLFYSEVKGVKILTLKFLTFMVRVTQGLRF